MDANLNFRRDLVQVQNELFRFAYKLTANYDDAKDLLQETSLKALYNEDKYIPGTNIKGWLCTIMRNVFINNYRKMVYEQTYIDQTDNLYFLNIPQVLESDNYNETEGLYSLKEIHHTINTLPEECKVLFRMHIAGFKYREISQRLKMPLGTIKSRIHLSRQILQKDLKDYVW
ncbi:ECF RNA polymerase sigma factor SigH [termite gut metagenome]|uniref:ECF RNA polymerase sigma factor SigH n=2 Tax=termite gut metagenome TaxID=433724 RepID=A0A5J4S6B7_9ZZZZ